MKKILLATAILLSCASVARADEPTPARTYVPAQDLRIVNKGFADSERLFSRLPASLRDSVRPDLWDRQECSAGLAVRFATDSKSVGVKYSLLKDFHMAHMADTGTKGTDLYIFEGDSVWRHVNTNRPIVKNEERMLETTYVQRLDGDMHEYMIYLPLYDGVKELWVVVDSGSTITPGNPEVISPRRRIVAYGTSIMQGGCASRTGMASSNIIGRELNAEVINLGFSGEGKMDAVLARTMAAIPDVDIYLLDPVPNCTEAMCDSLTYDFVSIIAHAHPDTPIVMVEGPMYPYSRYDAMFKNYLPAKNAAYRRNYERLVADGYTNIHYVSSDGLDGVEDDGTVDGIHLTDLGFRHYADKLLPVLRPLLEK